MVANAAGVVGRIVWGLSATATSAECKPFLLAITRRARRRAAPVPRAAHRAAGDHRRIVAVAGLALIGYQGLWITMIAEVAGPERVGAATGFAITFVPSRSRQSAALRLVADIAGTYRAIWAVLAAVLVVAFVPAALVHEEPAAATGA